MVAVLIGLPLSHCVDDIIGVDRRTTIMAIWQFWRTLAECSGWDVLNRKSPIPSETLIVIGIQPSFEALPDGDAVIEISKNRVSSFITQIDGILAQQACRAQ